MSRTPTELATFIAKYSPPIQTQFRAARSHLKKLLTLGYELVYDNYNGLGCGFSTTTKSSGIFISIVAYPKWITLFFFNGVRLPDPQRMLQGSGVKIRSLRLQPFTLLKSAEVDALLAHAINAVEVELAAAPKMTTVVKSVSAKQRPRRPK